MLAGLVATTVCSPTDVIETRIMNASKAENKSSIEILITALRTEGPSFMFRGWLPSFIRLDPFTMLIFFATEQLKKHKIGVKEEN